VMYNADVAGAGLSQFMTNVCIPTSSSLSSQRCVVTSTNTKFSDTSTVYVRPYFQFNVASAGLAVDVTVRIGMPQIETAAFETSVIPTSGTTVARVADTLNIPTAGWYSSSVGTFYSQFFWLNKTNNARVMALSGGAAPLVNNNVSFPTQWRNYASGTGPTATSSITPSLTTSIKVASAWKDVGTSSTISASNSAVVTGSYTAGGYSGATMTIGSAGGTFFMDAPIKQLKYYPLKVTDAQLRMLTQ